MSKWIQTRKEADAFFAEHPEHLPGPGVRCEGCSGDSAPCESCFIEEADIQYSLHHCEEAA